MSSAPGTRADLMLGGSHAVRAGVTCMIESTMADHVGACAATLMPLYELIKAHVFAAERIHGDDTTVPVLAKVKTPYRADLDLCP